MIITFGKYAGESLEMLLIKHADYVCWMFTQPAPSGSLRETLREARRLIAVFDRKAFADTCCRPGCDNVATRCTVHGRNMDMWPWCNECDPFGGGACQGKLQEIRTYNDALAHVFAYCGGCKDDYNYLLRNFVKAKGIQGNLTEKRLRVLFHEGWSPRHPLDDAA